MAYQTLQQRTFESNRDTLTKKENYQGYEKTQLDVTYNTLEYPQGELGSERYPHFTTFFINANSSSKLDEGSFFAPTSHGEIAVDRRTSDVSLAKQVVGKFTESNKRLNYVICLPMPMKLRNNYNASYTQTEKAGVVGSTLAAGFQDGQSVMQRAGSAANALVQTGMLKSGDFLKQGLKGAGSAAKDPRAKLALGAASAAIDPKLLEQMGQKALGAVINNRQEQLFESMNFRAHQMQWLFLPRSEEESESLFKICKTFKKHMHPEMNMNTGASMLFMPSEFDIEFRYGGEENSNIGKIATCVLKDTSVDYTPVGQFITFEGYSHPIAISLSLTFAEMEPLTREMIEKGF